MNTLKQSTLHNRQYFFSIVQNKHDIVPFINGYPAHQYENLTLGLKIRYSHSEYLNNKPLSSETIALSFSDYKVLEVIDNINTIEWVQNAFPSYQLRTVDELPDNRKQISQMRQKIRNIYNKYQEKNWDGYEAEPMKYLSQSLQFADMLSFESRSLIESADIIPENDGCLCFEWFKSDDKFISISVEDDQFIYNYKLGDEKGCGEVSFSGKQMLIDQIRKIM